jgi:hypothetical protein
MLIDNSKFSPGTGAQYNAETGVSEQAYLLHSSQFMKPKLKTFKIDTDLKVEEFLENMEQFGDFRIFMEPGAHSLTMVFDEFVLHVEGFNAYLDNGERLPQTLDVTATGTKIPELSDTFPKSVSARKYADWNYFDKRNSLALARLPLKPLRPLVQEAYPFIDDVDGWVDRFLDSNANVVILNGDPGTGKSTLINHIAQRRKANVRVVYDPKVMAKEELYAEVMEDSEERTILVLEDADINMSKRIGDDNGIMSTILNMSDGILDTSHFKIVLTGNLKRTDIDDALLRTGRCFAVVDFRQLDREEAEALARKCDLSFDFDAAKNESFTLTELFNGLNQKKAKIGFF